MCRRAWPGNGVFLLQESDMCNKLASLAQAREAHGAFGKALRERGPSKMLFSYMEKGCFEHRRTKARHC